MEGLSDAEARQAHQAPADLTERRLELRDEAESAVRSAVSQGIAVP